MKKEERKNEFVKAKLANMAFPYHVEDDFTEACKDCFEAGVEFQKNKAIKILSSILDNWVHGGDADCIIAEFEEKLNNE